MSREKLQEMDFWSHVEALRSTLLRAGGIVFVIMFLLFCFMPWIFQNIVLAPCHGDFVLYRIFESMSRKWAWIPDFSTAGFEVRLINIQLASQFFIHVSASFWMAVILAFPVILWLMWKFVSPGLYDYEKRGVERAFFLGNLMFYLGIAVGYFVVFPVTLRFLSEYRLSEMIPNQISLDSYMDNFYILILVMGIVFELPLLAWLLGRMGILSRSFFNRFRRHAIVALLILAAVITPTGDPFTLMVVFLPIYILWELSAFLVPGSEDIA